MRWMLLLLMFVAAGADAQRLLEPQQFIDRSVITFPKSSGEYVLREVHYDPAQWTHGITSKWSLGAAPDGLRLTVFVYPLGTAQEADAVAQQMQDVEFGLQDAVRQGVYANLVAGKRTAFVVRAPRPSLVGAGDGDGASDDADLTPLPEVSVETDGADPIAKTLLAGLPSPNSHGQRQSFRLDNEGAPTRSLGYVFYRHLFAIKVRVSTPADSMDDATFEALADTATRTLVPRILVENYGRCGAIGVPVAPSAPDAQDGTNAATEQMLLEMARVRRDNCATVEGATPAHAPRAEERVEIVYPPGTWEPSTAP